MTTRPRVALATCAEFSQYDEDAPALLAALGARSLAVETVDWDDPSADWAAYDLVVISSTWDYVPRRDEFIAWAQRVPHLLNPPEIVRWNTYKGYLKDLASAGVPVVPTAFLAPDDPVDLPVAGEYVVKPAVGAGARDTSRYTTTDDAAAATSHILRLQQRGATVMVQPYLAGIDIQGETALLYLGGEYSHCVRKGALLETGAGDPGDVYRAPTIAAAVAEHAELKVAEQALDAVPGGAAQLLYARVDLLPGPSGSPVLLELELTEPSLYLTLSPDAPARYAAAIAGAADRVVGSVT